MVEEKISLTSRIVKVFLTSRLSILFVIASLLSGALALLVTPREEEPQIVVPVADILVNAPGATAEEVEKLVAKPLESLLWEIDGVEYVYTFSRPGMAVATVRFFVGEDRENSLVKIYNKMMSNVDRIPPIVTQWIVKPIEIDDVPILTLTFFPKDSGSLTDYDLRRIAEEVLGHLQEVVNTSRSFVVGGRPRQVRVLLDPARLAAHDLCALEVSQALGAENVNVPAGSLRYMNEEIRAEVGPFFKRPEEVESAVVGVYQGRPVYVRDVATVEDGPAEVETYTRIGFGPAYGEHGEETALVQAEGDLREERPAVTLAIAKRKGANAVEVADKILDRVRQLQGDLLPEGLAIQVTRNYGKTANEKVNELVDHLGIAVATIVVLIAFALGWREAFIVALAVPITLAVTLLGDLIVGYTINRVTLFALILSLGLLVDDPIVDVENIHRHFRLRKRPPLDATLVAVDEVRPPTILATFAVIVSFLPMFFVTGMMGPYMRPMPFNVPLAMLMSLVVAFTVTPWATYHMLKGEYDKPRQEKASEDHEEGAVLKRLYRRLLLPMLERPARGWIFLAGLFLAFLLSIGLVLLGMVPLKMLPYDNKSELQIVIDMPEGSTLEYTAAVTSELGAYMATLAEVTDYETYVGTASPFDFNGLVRHYFFRHGDNVADIRINLVEKHARKQQSHQLALRIRPRVEEIARKYGANVKIVEMPPGPPVMATLVAEVYGPEGFPYEELEAVSRRVRALFEDIEGVVDVDDTTEANQEKIRFLVDREKAALHGIPPERIARCVQMAIGGIPAGTVHLPGERMPLMIVARVPEAKRSHPDDMLNIYLEAADGSMVSLAELGHLVSGYREQTIYHKNLKPVVYVTGETAGISPAIAVLSMQKTLREEPLPPGYSVDWRGEGEWKITLDVFRDLGMAFGAALILIYVLLVAQTGSLLVPVVIMVAIPLTIIGIMPGFALLNLILDKPIGPYATPVFFTATGMIGMIALAGIVVRNSIILIDFIHLIMDRGEKDLKEAIIEAGAVRTRPILLTAGAAMFGSWVITLDPIFSGLAWSFIFGIFASTAFSLLVVPVVYYLIYRNKEIPLG